MERVNDAAEEDAVSLLTHLYDELPRLLGAFMRGHREVAGRLERGTLELNHNPRAPVGHGNLRGADPELELSLPAGDSESAGSPRRFRGARASWGTAAS